MTNASYGPPPAVGLRPQEGVSRSGGTVQAVDGLDLSMKNFAVVGSDRHGLDGDGDGCRM
jgi:hypothetical protein